MKNLLILLSFITFTNSFAADVWVSTGIMSQGNNDWVYAMNSNSNGDLFASSWAVGIYKGNTANNTSWSFSGLSGKRVSNIFTAPNGYIYAYSKTTSMTYIHRSTDNGASWQDVFTRAFSNNYAGGGAMVFMPNGNIVAGYAVTVGPTIGDVATYVFTSTNNGNDWAHKNTLYGGFTGGMQLLDDGRIFMGTSLAGVIQTTNEGANWSNVTTFPPIYIHDILQDKEDVLYVCDAYGFNRSTDNGQTFVDLGPSVSGYMIEASFVDSQNNLYVSYNHDHVYRSTNKGDSWQLLTAGLPSTTYICSFTEANGKIYAGTNNEGTFYLRNTTVGVQNGNEIIEKYSLKQNYPNPFNPATRINYELPMTNHITIKVYDAIGNEVKTLVNGKQNAGSYSVNFDASALPSGVYYYKLVTENFSDTKKMILVK
jgi:hypothetical protein